MSDDIFALIVRTRQLMREMGPLLLEDIISRERVRVEALKHNALLASFEKVFEE